MLPLIMNVMAFLFLMVAGYTDLKRREVPDWLNYALIFAAIGIRTMFSLQDGWHILISGLLGLGAGIAIAFLLYFTNFWGGGDSKLLMAMGAVIGITYPPDSSSFDLLIYFLAMMFLGAIYGLLWMVAAACMSRRIFLVNFKHNLAEFRTTHFIIVLVGLGLMLLGFIDVSLLALGLFPLAFFYLFTFISSLEGASFVKKIAVSRLTEGDWLAEDVVVEGKTLVPAKTIEMEDLKKLHQASVQQVRVKEGVPFVPSFIFAYIFMYFSGQFFAWAKDFLL